VFPTNAPPVGDCASGWCWVYPLPQGYGIGGLAGTGENDLWAFPSAGATAGGILHFDGTSWKDQAVPAGCKDQQGWIPWQAAANDLWVAGACIMHWDGKSWSGTETYGLDTAIGGIGRSDIWRGGDGYALHWDGAHWSSMPALPAAPIAFGGSGTTTLAVSSGGQITQWTGSAWGYVDPGSHQSNAAVVLDATHIVFAQDGGSIAFWTNRTWTTQTAPVSASWKHIVATSPSDVWVTGSDDVGAVLVYHWDGTTWSPAGSPSDRGYPTVLWQDPGGALWLASDSSLISMWDGSTWSAKTTGDNRAAMTWGTDWDNVWFLGDSLRYLIPQGTYVDTFSVMHWNGTAWVDTAFPYQFSDGYRINAGWSSGPDDAWLAGGHSPEASRMLFHWNGSVWSLLGPFGTDNAMEAEGLRDGFTSIWGAASNDIYALAPHAVFHYDGSAWTAVAGLPGGVSLFGSSANDVYVINGQQLWNWNGVAWTVETTTPSLCRRGWANSPTDIWLDSFHYDGFVLLRYPDDRGAGTLVGSSNDMFSLEGGTTREWKSGFDGAAITGHSYLGATSAWRTPDGHIFAAGLGLIVH
jgi:hypothetical protein